MLIRKPVFYDIYKAVKFLTTDEKERENLLVEWIMHFKQNPKFYSLIALERKEVVGVLTGHIAINQDKKVVFNLSVLNAGTPATKQKLCEKVLKDIDPDICVHTGTDVDFLQSIGFLTVSVNLIWANPKHKPSSDKDKDEVINAKTVKG